MADLAPVFMELSFCPKADMSYKLSQTLILKRCESNYPLCDYLKNNNYIFNLSPYSDTDIHYRKFHFRALKPVKPIKNCEHAFVMEMSGNFNYRNYCTVLPWY